MVTCSKPRPKQHRGLGCKIFDNIVKVFLTHLMIQHLLKHTVYALLFSVVFTSVHAQEKNYKEPTGLNNWYVELGGSALFYSGNYEKVLYKEQRWGWVGRVGVGYNPGDYTLLNTVSIPGGTVMAPFHTAALYGPNKEKLEMGLGFTMLATSVNNREIIPTAVLGFRVVETNKVCFRANWTPFIRNGEFVSWFGVSLGKNFSTGKR
jgi:hypothetical protein